MPGISLTLGILFQVVVGGMLGMLAIFAGASLHDRRELSALQSLILNQAMWLLPAVSAVIALFFIYQFTAGGKRPSLLWHLLPVAVGGLYLAYAATL